MISAVRSLLRLGTGALDWRYACGYDALLRSGLKPGQTLSVDLFGTLLIRSDETDLLVALAAFIRSGIPATGVPQSVRVLVAEAQRKLRDAWTAEGKDPEIPRAVLIGELIRKLRGREPLPQEIRALCDFELEMEFLRTAPNAELADLIERHRRSGGNVVVTSDMHYSAEDLASLIARHGVTGVGRIYASSDIGKSKFRGGLYEHVLAAEGADRSTVVHVGDRRLSDVWSARAQGITSAHFARRIAQSEPEPVALERAGYAVGYSVLGPALSAFAHLLLLEAGRRGLDRLAFVARDGDLLMRVTAIVARSPAVPNPPALQYLSISRRSTMLAGQGRLDASSVGEALAVRAGGGRLARVLGYFNVPCELVRDVVAVHHIELHDPGVAPAKLRALFADPAFGALVEAEAQRQKGLLREYLMQESVYGAKRLGLVDIGWGGSIRRALAGAFAGEAGFRLPAGLYLGRWTERSASRLAGDDATGILSDCLRSKSVREGGAWYLAAFLEALSRAAEGPIVGYERAVSGRIEPVRAEDTPSREAERQGELLREPIRRGILAFAAHYARQFVDREVDEEALRREAQRQLFRLAFFPDTAEIRIGRSLTQTEGHADGWSAALIQQGPNPLASPLRWLAGLTSPWRTGYIRATGGPLLTMAWIALEALLLAQPAAVRERLRRIALRVSRAGE